MAEISTQTAALVNSLYNTNFGRDADPEGLAFWANQIDSGAMTPGAVVEAFGNVASAETPDPNNADVGARYRMADEAQQAANTAFVENLYGTDLDRASDVAGLNYWSNALNLGKLTQEQVANEFAQAAKLGEAEYGLLGNERLGEALGISAEDAAALRNYNASDAGATPDTISVADGLLGTTAPGTTVPGTTVPGVGSAPGTYLGPMSGGSQTYYNVIPFGSTYAGGNIYTPGFLDDAAYAPTIQNAFEQQMLYQSQLPNLIPQFDINAISPIVTQSISPGTRFDIGQTVVPDWLRVETPAEARELATGKSIADIQREDAAKQTQADEQAAQYVDND